MLKSATQEINKLFNNKVGECLFHDEYKKFLFSDTIGVLVNSKRILSKYNVDPECLKLVDDRFIILNKCQLLDMNNYEVHFYPYQFNDDIRIIKNHWNYIEEHVVYSDVNITFAGCIEIERGLYKLENVQIKDEQGYNMTENIMVAYLYNHKLYLAINELDIINEQELKKMHKVSLLQINL